MAHIVLTLLRLRCLGVLALATLALPLVAAPVARGQAPNEITYTKHVAPIIQQKCQVCHQPNSIAPMSLLTYEDAKSVSNEMREYLSTRVMPPFHVDRAVGIKEFKNDRGLSDEQLNTILRWIDGGMPFGKKEDLPPNPKFPDPTGWQSGLPVDKTDRGPEHSEASGP